MPQNSLSVGKGGVASYANKGFVKSQGGGGGGQYLPLLGNDQTVATPPAGPITGRVYQLRASTIGPGDDAWFVNRRARGTPTAPASVITNDSIGQFQMQGYAGGSWIIAATIQAVVIDPAPSATSFRTQLNFNMCPTGGYQPALLMSLTDTQLSLVGQGIFNTALGAANANITWQSESGSAQLLVRKYSTDANANYLQFYKARGASAAPSVVATSDQLGSVVFSGYNGSSYNNCSAIRSFCIDPAPSTSSMQGQLQIGIVPVGVTAINYGSLVLDFTNGAVFGIPNVVIRPRAAAQSTSSAILELAKPTSGAANPTTSSIQGMTNTAGTTLNLRSQIDLCDSTNEAGSNAGSNFAIRAYSDAGALLGNYLSAVRSTQVVTFPQTIVNGSSDRTLKENIEPLTDCLNKINALQGVSFNMIGSENKQIGLIAQDVEPTIPEIIQHFDHQDGPKLALDYPKLVAVLIEAVKELTARVSALEA
jgi:Chaperone of endosialidase